MQINPYFSRGFYSAPLPKTAGEKYIKREGNITSDCCKLSTDKTKQTNNPAKNNQVTGSETETTDKIKNTSSLPDHLFEYIQNQAAEDARNGIYMSQKYISSTLKYMRKNISPNRSKLISMFNPMVMNAKYTGKPASFFSVPGFSGFTARFSVGRMFGAYMSIWNKDGEQVLSYSPPPNAGWHEHQTKAESKFIDEADAVYMKVYDEVRAQMKAETALGGSYLNKQI